jgi:hypothetical protein
MLYKMLAANTVKMTEFSRSLIYLVERRKVFYASQLSRNELIFFT